MNWTAGLVRSVTQLGDVVKLAKTALFLASDDSSYTTGTKLVVDGGLTQSLMTSQEH